MSDLLSLLNLGAAGIAAQNAGISIASNNVANANTEGYSRQRVDLEANVTSVLGVRAGAPDRFADSLLGSRMRVASGALARSQALGEALGDLESRLTSGASMNEQLAAMFASFAEAASSPTDAISRDAAIAATDNLVDGIRRRAAELTSAHGELDARVRDKAAQVTELAQKLADANLAIAKTNDPVMKDERDRVANQLSALVGGSARVDANGQMRFVLDGGAVLVDGKRAAKLEAGPDGTLDVVDGASRRDVTADVSGGALGAVLNVRDGALAKARTDLDQLAYDVASAMNTVHRGHAGLDGATGRDLFAPLAGPAGAASQLAIDPALVADPSRLALGAAGAGTGSNAGALALYQVATGKVATGGKTLGDAALGIIGGIARATATAKSDVARDQIVSDHLAGLQDSLAGVDLQEELTNLTRFEHASSAMTRFVSTIDSLLGDLIDRL